MSESNHTRPSDRALADTLPAEEKPRVHPEPLAGNGAPILAEPGEIAARRGLADTLDAPPRTPQIPSAEPRSGPPSSPELARLRISEPQRYRIGSEFAQGGIGRILSARDERLDRARL
jgi:hypothetical protein